MLIELPAVWMVITNTLAWLSIHLGVAYVMTQLSAGSFDHRGW